MISFIEEFTYCYAHRITGLSSSHRCSKLHGHTATLRVEALPPAGKLLDHAVFREAIMDVVGVLDHAGVMNAIDEALNDGTQESQLIWFAHRLPPALAKVGAQLLSMEHAEFSGGLSGTMVGHVKRWTP
jgi:6-pyruvoyltetrahydropterin/6-carboxytetrahydropterin synthase